MIRRSPRPTRTDTLFHYTTRFRSRVLSSRWVSRSIAPTSGGAQGDRRAEPSLLAVAINQDAAPRSQHDTGKLQAHLRGRLHAQRNNAAARSEEHTSELQSLMRISYAVFCLKKKKKTQLKQTTSTNNIQTTT